ncbi:hypothetical protein OO013_04025 [Mangrovivirga sp. M17]|uniref:DUF4468 domain-containing protein n=1 Tax=Mangrovivirga halotolerans TaxID=2993936 RepID=A0ABT3RP30_9BACT|nr:hypothetical protein [Mangrovivirga halotolerans]MCX2743017.1 hypothetical protein [Mangrovivirga halotolerans]
MLYLLISSLMILNPFKEVREFKEKALSDTVYIKSEINFDFNEKFSDFKKVRKKESDNFKFLVSDKENDYFSFIDGYYLKSQILLGKKVVGAIRYHVTLKMIDDKIILNLDNPTFLPYEKNRFGRMEPKYGREMSFSKLSTSRLDEKVREEIIASFESFSTEYLEKLKVAIISG